jgi:hypothetical protein
VRHPHPPSADRDKEQLERIRKKNRDVATKFRQRQRDLGSSLEAKIAELSDERTGLLGERDSLQSEALALTSQVNALQCLTGHPPPASPAVLSSSGLPSPALLSPGLISPAVGPGMWSPGGFDVGYGGLLAGTPESGVGQADVAFSNPAILQTFSMDDLAAPTPDDYGFPTVPDPMDHDIHEDQT